MTDIVVVSDNKYLRAEWYDLALDFAPARVTAAASFSEAEKAIAGKPSDTLVISDFKYPGKKPGSFFGALDLLQSLKDRASPLPVAILADTPKSQITSMLNNANLLTHVTAIQKPDDARDFLKRFFAKPTIASRPAAMPAALRPIMALRRT